MPILSPHRPVLFVACLFVAASLVAQRPVPMQPLHPGGKAATVAQKALCTSDAGEIAGFGNFNLSSSSFGNPASLDTRPFGSRPDTIFLCFGDSFTALYAAGTEDLSGDPIPATRAGIGYAFYDCPPTVTGTTNAEIQADPCVADDGISPFDQLAVTVPGGFFSSNYDLVVDNTAATGVPNPTIMSLFPDGNGEPQPVVLTIAPITVDSVTNASGTLIPVPESELDGDGNVLTPECINVRTDQTFSVAFLNPIELANLNATPVSCDGTFDIRGGVSQLRGTADYTISITNNATGETATLANPTNTYRHNDVVEYTVPSAGTYTITVVDEVSCDLSAVSVTHPEGCLPPPNFSIDCAGGDPNTTACIAVRATNFVNVSAFNFAIQYDATVLDYTGDNNLATELTAGTFADNELAAVGTTGEVRIVYDNPGNPATLADNAVIVELCFDVTGNVTDRSPLNFTPARSATIESGGTPTAETPSTTDCSFLTTSTVLGFIDNVQAVTCPGESDGSITVIPFGGTAPYVVTYVRTIPGPPTSGPAQTVVNELDSTTFVGLIAGFYDVTVTDDNGNGGTTTTEIQVTEGISFGVSIDVFQRPQCNGDANGILIVEVSENTNPVPDPASAGYSIQWNTGAATDTISGLEDGTYSVTITDINSGCTRDALVNLDEPNALFIDVSQSPVTDATCTGADDGSILVRAVGGVQDAGGAYTFNWSDGFMEQAPESNRQDLAPGDYEVTVVDVNGCDNARPFTVSADKELIITSVVDSISCFGSDDGRISVAGSFAGQSPALPYEVTITNLDPAGTPIGPLPINDPSVPLDFDNLPPGTYEIMLVDQDPAGCATFDTVIITEPELLEIDDDNIITVNAGCPDVLGTAEIPVSGGTQPYEFRFVNDSLDMPLDSITLANNNRIAELQPDTNYMVIVTDANGCIDSAEFQILAPAGAFIEPIQTAFVDCPGDANAQLTVVATPPMGETITGYTWFRVNPDGTLGNPVANTATTQANLSVGFYAVEITTSNQCTALDFGAVESPGLVVLDSFTLNNPSCPGDANGSIFVSASGGTPNADGTYNYVWSTDPNGAPVQNPVLTNLTAGTYGVTIVDANNCQPTFDTTFVLSDPPAIVGEFLITDVSCPDDATDDGAATFSADFSDGSLSSFDFDWSNGDVTIDATESSIVGLTRGPLSVRVTDGICTATFRDTVGSPEDFLVLPQATDVSCNGLADGSVAVDVSGGTAEYTFSWVGIPETDNIVDGLAAGTYTFEITDANGCSPGTQTATVQEPDELVVEVNPALTTEVVTCAGDADGVIDVFVASANNNPLGDNPYTWSANVVDNDDATARNLSPGTYGVTLTDVRGCQDSLDYTIEEPDAITFTVDDIEPPLCFGETTPVLVDTAFGGRSNDVSDFTFTVNNDGFLIPVGQSGSAFAGDITVTVFDTVGCTAEQTFSVNQPPQILIDLPEEITIELGDTTTQLNPLISPAGDVYAYLWTPADFLSSDSARNPVISPRDSRDYTLTVTNQNGCQAFADIFVEVDANRNVFIPNAFSPNRDGRNEDFRIFACQGVDVVNTVRVFDRWGGLVFSQDNISPNCLDGIQLWDGIGQNGKPVNPGVFVYMIEVSFLDNVTLLYRGDITVLR